MLIPALGNSLRVLVKHLTEIKDEEITSLESPTGEPIVDEIEDPLNAVETHF